MQPSRNRFQGSLSAIDLRRVLEECKRNLITGTVEVRSPQVDGRVELRAGTWMTARAGDDRDHAAVERLCDAAEGTFEIVQRLPAPSGVLADSASCHGDLAVTPLVALMRYCEENALSCTIDVVSGDLRGSLTYWAGEIEAVCVDGVRDEDRIVELTTLREGRFDVSVPQLDLALPGHPRFARATRQPFGFGVDAAEEVARDDADAMPRTARGTQPVRPVGDEAPHPLPLRPVSLAARTLERGLSRAESAIAAARRRLRQLVD